MITPKFSCSQNEKSVTISMFCPSVRATDVEIHVDGNLVSIHVNPYFLRLNFEHSVLEDNESSAKYDPSSGYLTVTLTKETPRQEFQDLDLLAKLLAPRLSQGTPVIEVLDETNAGDDETLSDESADVVEAELVNKTQNLSLDLNEERAEILKASENDWQLPQKHPSAEETFSISAQQHYGFLNLHSGYFRHVTTTENEVNELDAEAETLKPEQRRRRRIKHEDEKFDPEYYMADFADDEQIQELLHWKHPHIAASDEFQWKEKEQATMLRLPRKEYIPTKKEMRQLYLTLVTLLFSYAYESRTNQHDPTPESPWTISVLTPAFSALDPPSPLSLDDSTFSTSELQQALVASYRRSFSFPLYRSWALAEACRKDVAEILKKGKRTVVRCLLEMKDILDHHEVYYAYSKIWVDPFCVWAQQASNDVLLRLSRAVHELRMDKGAIGWDLENLEAATQGVERESDSDDED